MVLSVNSDSSKRARLGTNRRLRRSTVIGGNRGGARWAPTGAAMTAVDIAMMTAVAAMATQKDPAVYGGGGSSTVEPGLPRVGSKDVPSQAAFKERERKQGLYRPKDATGALDLRGCAWAWPRLVPSRTPSLAMASNPISVVTCRAGHLLVSYGVDLHCVQPEPYWRMR